MACSAAWRQPRLQGARTLRNAGPSADALARLLHQVAPVVRRRLGHVRDVVGGHDAGQVLAPLHLAGGTTLPAGEVVVSAPQGVALERWMPVFM